VIGHGLDQVANRLWPGLATGYSEPACGWCGWSHDDHADDARPAWECCCHEAEAAAGRRCARCYRIFTAAHPAIQVRITGLLTCERIHRQCLLPGDHELSDV
jgi:hypothetical protein